MKDLVDRYLTRRLSRRGFVARMARWGFSVAAIQSIVDSLDPPVQAQELAERPTRAAPEVRMAHGTGGDLLVEQLHAASVLRSSARSARRATASRT